AAEEEIKKSKEDFYTKYSYLKPECEKSVIEHICDGVQSAAEWCKEHWKLIVTIAIVIVSVAVLLIPGVGPIIAGACWGAILGACIGGVSGGLESVANGGSFLEGFEDGALSGAISGAIGGAAFAGLGQLGAVAGKGIKCMSGFGKFIKGTASVTKVMSTAMGGFDTIALVDKAFGNGDIATLNAKLHESKAYNIFQTGVAATAVFTGGMTTTMKCFVAGTLVLTASGLVAIENIKPGDMVYAADAETLEVSTKQVLETYIRETSSLVHLTINGENIISTYDHPYYVKDKGFVSAGALWIGAELIDKDGNVVLD
ncbi:MAG: polymorphic toxin-type HINT domain-containing protein, partial [Ruminococcus sp.]|nr:polymorphic toxin-type HINT domain-containing protein [Ruminococcus sp.]